MMHIGLIGGIGPAATAAYYTGLVRAFSKAGTALELTISHADIAVLAENARDNQPQRQATVFAGHIDRLAAAGCDVAMITALTGHFCFDETRSVSALPLIDGIELIDNHCRDRGIGMLGLLGSPVVMETHLFGRLHAPRTVVPGTGLDRLGETYMSIANSGECTEENRQALFTAGANMVQEQGADAVLLAGTDLGLAFNGHEPGYAVIDALEIHIEALMKLAADGALQ